MKRSIANNLSKLFYCSGDFNRKIIRMKRSWDEVQEMINKNCHCKPNRCNK